MERVKWEKPRAEVQAFVADDYVAVCYTLTCDAGDVGLLDQQTIYSSKSILAMVGTKQRASLFYGFFRMV